MTEGTQTTLRKMREAAGLSIRDLSQLTNINRGRLSIIERGVVASAEETRAILTALTEAQAKQTGDEAA
jgi:transcriptional regulator with XRE-family HTH domain